MKNLDASSILNAFRSLDEIATKPFRLIVGGGGALVGAYRFPLATEDIDAVPVGIELHELNPLIDSVRSKLSLAGDWLNPYFSTFMHTLPTDYKVRLKSFYKGQWVEALALGPEDLLIMKCFAARDKDVPHARALLRVPQLNLEMVETHLLDLIERRIHGAKRALEFFEEVTEDK